MIDSIATLTLPVEAGVGLVGLGVGYALYSAARLIGKEKEAHPKREVEIGCPCGAFRATIRLPLDNTPSAACCCHDCVDFATWLEEGKKCPVKILHHKAVQMVQVFKQDVRITQGGEQVRRAMLRPSSHVTRYYTGCCNMALGLTPNLSSYPIIILHKELFGDHKEKLGPHTWCLFTSRQYSDPSSLPAQLSRGGQSVCSPHVGFSFLLRVIFRVLYGILRGKGSPDPTTAFTCPEIDYINIIKKEE